MEDEELAYTKTDVIIDREDAIEHRLAEIEKQQEELKEISFQAESCKWWLIVIVILIAFCIVLFGAFALSYFYRLG